MTRYLDNINWISQLLSQEKVILCPTDTIWGLSCDAFSQKAVDKIYEIKKRDKHKTMIILVDDIPMLKKYVINIHPRIETLMALHESPLPVIHQSSDNLPDYLLTKERTIAIRVTKNDLLREIISDLGRPIISTSANVQGEPSPQSYDLISNEVTSQVDYIFQSGRLAKSKNPASTIIRYSQEGELFFLR